MAITQVGSTLQFAGTTNGTGTVSSTITVPATTELVVVAVIAYTGLVGEYRMNDGIVSFTKGGTDTAMIGTSHNGETDDAMATAMWYMVSPDIGTNKSLKFSWEGAGGLTGVANWSLTFWTGINTADPVRDSDGEQQNALPINTPTLTAVSGDKIIAFCGFYNGAADGTGTIDTWSNLTEIGEITHNTNVEGAWAAGNPSGDTAVGATTGTNATFLAISALVVKAASGTSVSVAVTGVAATGSVGSVTVSTPAGGGGSVTGRKSAMIGMGRMMGR